MSTRLPHRGLLLGDQLDLDPAAFDGFDAVHTVWKNLARLDDAQKQAIRERAAAIRKGEIA